MERPTSAHLLARKRILRYSKRIIDFGLLYEKGRKNFIITTNSDNNFCGDADDKKSTLVQIFCHSKLAITWSSMT